MMSVDQQWVRNNAHVMLNAVTEALISVDGQGFINYANRAATSLFAFASADMIGQKVTLLLPEFEPTKHRDSNGVQPAEIGLRDKQAGTSLIAKSRDGSEFMVSVVLSEIQHQEGSWSIVVLHPTDKQNTLQKSLSEQRERFAQINRLSTLGEMALNIAHEINQPLAAIAMYAQVSRRLLVRDDIDKLKLVEALEKLNLQTLRAGEVIERIQYLVRSDAGVREQVSINQILQDIFPLLLADVRANGMDLELILPNRMLEVVCDSSQIQQVLINLVRNAIDAMLEIHCKYGRLITIDCVGSKTGSVDVSVIDRGPGIDEALQTSIFNAFQTSKKRGTGLGLPVSRSMIEHHDGSLSCKNNPDQGVTFTFSLASVVS